MGPELDSPLDALCFLFRSKHGYSHRCCQGGLRQAATRKVPPGNRSWARVDGGLNADVPFRTSVAATRS